MRASSWLPLISLPRALYMFVAKSVFKLQYNVVFDIVNCLFRQCVSSLYLFVPSHPVLPHQFLLPPIGWFVFSSLLSCLSFLVFSCRLLQAKQEEINAVANAGAKSVRVLLYRTLGGDGEELRGDFTENHGTEYYKIAVQVNFIEIDVPSKFVSISTNCSSLLYTHSQFLQLNMLHLKIKDMIIGC